MAGGMNRPGGSGSLAARTASPAATDDGRRVERLRRRHCWVLAAEPEPGPWPGLVAEWRRGDEGWQARVVYLLGETSTTREEWVPAARLRPGNWPG